jgi:hypothetical protein
MRRMPYCPEQGKAPVANVLPREKRLGVLAALVDGNSERATERMTGVTRPTIAAFAVKLGTAAQHLHNARAYRLAAAKIEQDEIWSYVGKKQARVTPEEHAAGLGEAYSFVSLAMPARFVITWTVGKRDQDTANAFEADTRARVVLMPEINTDGLAAYPVAIGTHFGPGVDYAQVVKHYTKGGRRDDDHRYEPPREPFLTKHAVFGAPDVDRATTAHIERNNGTMRHLIGRMRRLVYAFSKSVEHHNAAVALAYVHYNMCWIPRTTRVTPAMAIGVTTHPWDLPELLDALLSVPETAPPTAQPLAPRKPETTARELPGGRGFLRVVQGTAAPVTPPPAPPVAPVPAVAVASPTPQAPPAPAPTVTPTGATGVPRGKPRKPSQRLPLGQLSLFGIEIAPPKPPEQT